MAEWFLLNKVFGMYIFAYFIPQFMANAGKYLIHGACGWNICFVCTPENARHVWPSQMSGGRKLALRRRRHILALRPKRQFHQQVVSCSNSFIYCAAMQFSFAVYIIRIIYDIMWWPLWQMSQIIFIMMISLYSLEDQRLSFEWLFCKDLTIVFRKSLHSTIPEDYFCSMFLDFQGIGKFPPPCIQVVGRYGTHTRWALALLINEVKAPIDGLING